MAPTEPAKSGSDPTEPASMSPAARFEQVVANPTGGRQLIDGAIEIARRGQPQPTPGRYELDIDALENRLDALAAACPGDPATPGSVMSHLFSGSAALRGNEDDYYNAENSYLNHVVEKRLGIPITLAVVAIDVARRRGVTMVGISMPGHFLVGLAGAARYFDPFNGGAESSAAECRERFHAVAGAETPFLDTYLDSVPPAMILWRMLNNLEGIAQRRKDPAMLAWVLQFKARFDQAPPDVGHRAAVLFKNSGQYLVAAKELERLVERAGPEVAEKSLEDLRSKARRLRARLN